MPGDPVLDELLSRFGAGERAWELGARLAAVLAAAGRTAQVPGIVSQCRPLKLDSLGAEKIVELASDLRVAFEGWRLPRSLGGSGILVYGDRACEVRMGDAFLLGAGRWELQRSTGERIASSAGTLDESTKADVSSSALFVEMQSAFESYAAAIGATVVRSAG